MAAFSLSKHVGTSWNVAVACGMRPTYRYTIPSIPVINPSCASSFCHFTCTISLAFVDALSLSIVQPAWDGCDYCGAMVVLKPTEQPLWSLSRLICAAFVFGEKGGRSYAPTSFGSSLALHLCKMSETAVVGVQSVSGVQIGLLKDSRFLLSLRQFLAENRTHRE